MRKIANNCRFHTSYQMHPLINKSCGFLFWCSFSVLQSTRFETGRQEKSVEKLKFSLWLSVGRKLSQRVTLIKSQYVIKLIKRPRFFSDRAKKKDLSCESLRLKRQTFSNWIVLRSNWIWGLTPTHLISYVTGSGLSLMQQTSASLCSPGVFG